MKRASRILVLIAIVSALAVFFLVATAVYAAAYYPHYYEQSPPDQGQWWWTNGSLITWETTSWWDKNSAAAIRAQYWQGGDPTIEVEGYDPGKQTGCDKLNVSSVTIYNLPVASYQIINGDCPNNNTNFKEQVDIHIKADSNFKPRVWYDHWVKYQKVGSGASEANFSYEVSCCCNDCWLGKVMYDSNKNATCASPSGVLDGKPGCP